MSVILQLFGQQLWNLAVLLILTRSLSWWGSFLWLMKFNLQLKLVAAIFRIGLLVTQLFKKAIYFLTYFYSQFLQNISTGSGSRSGTPKLNSKFLHLGVKDIDQLSQISGDDQVCVNSLSHWSGLIKRQAVWNLSQENLLVFYYMYSSSRVLAKPRGAWGGVGWGGVKGGRAYTCMYMQNMSLSSLENTYF